MHFPSFYRTPIRLRAGSLSSQSSPTYSLGVVHFGNSDEVVIAVADENEVFLHECVAEWNSSKERIAWFETVDGCFVGLNLAQVDVIEWILTVPEAAVATEWDQDHLVAHFPNGLSTAVSRVSGDDIDRLRGATIANFQRKRLHTLSGQKGDPVSINLDTLMYITMPAIWLNDDGS